MKKISVGLLLLATAFAASAQNMYDGLIYSDINYYGTARTIGLGNAVSALGGDLGTIGINPAGSAVSNYSQFTITPNLSIGKTSASYSPYANGTYDAHNQMNRSRMTLPNIGMVTTYKTGRSSGLKRISYGLVSNATNTFADRMSVTGRNEKTSMMAHAADWCTRNAVSPSDLDSFDSGIAWPHVLAYKSGMIALLNDALVPNTYIGSTEALDADNNFVVAGPLHQSYYTQHSGSKNDVVVNLGLDFSDRFFLGFNLGMQSLTYKEAINQIEEAVNPSDFSFVLDGRETAFNAARQRYALDVNGTGLYGKVGMIWLPVQGLRVAAAVQTPALMTVTERWRWDATCEFEGSKPQLYESPDGEYTYDLVTPAVYTLGVAYTFGSLGLLSFDYERSNSASMRFRDSETFFGGTDSWSDVNREIRDYAGATNAFRVGAEYKILPTISLRGGYGFKQYKSVEVKEITSSYSFGIGYSSCGAFFADFAVRNTLYPESFYYPYDNYLVDCNSPEVRTKKSVFDVVFTFGWRFSELF